MLPVSTTRIANEHNYLRHRPLPHARYKLNRKSPITIQRSLHTTILHALSETQTSGTQVLAIVYIIIRAYSDVKGFSKLCSNQEYTASKLFPYLKFKAKQYKTDTKLYLFFCLDK